MSRRSVACLALATSLALVLALDRTSASGADFLSEVERGRRAVVTSDAATQDGAAARAASVQSVLRTDGGASVGFTIGAILAALDLDLTSPPGSDAPGDRAVVEQQVRDLLAAQRAAGIGNRALCLLSGRSAPKSLESQIRLVERRWSCEKH